MLHEPLPIKRKLESFLVYSTLKSELSTLTSVMQVVINASPNLRRVKIPWGFYPDFQNSTFLDSLTIVLDKLEDSDIARFEPSSLSRMLNQVADQLVTLCFGEFDGVEFMQGHGHWDRKRFRLPKRMPKLETYRNMVLDIFQCDDVLQDLEKTPALKTLVIGKTLNTPNSESLYEFLQTIFDAGKILGGVTTLKIFELYDPSLLEGLKTAFPNLVRLEVGSDDEHLEDENDMKLGVVLKACGSWKGLKRFNLSREVYTEPIKETILALLEGRELYKGLKTFEIAGYGYLSYKKHHLTSDELELLIELLLAMNGMDKVFITYLNFSEESKKKIFELMASNNLAVSKFQIFRGISLPSRLEEEVLIVS